MASSFVSRIALFAALLCSVVSCSSWPPDEPVVHGGQAHGGMFLHGQRHDPGGSRLQNASAPPGAHLDYFGGRIMSNIQVVQVIYGAGSYLPEVTSTATPSMATFYQGVLNSPYVDWLTEYNTNTTPPPASNQTLGRGSFLTQAMITPSAANDGTVIDDSQIQAELSSQVQAGNLPAPTHDAQGNNNTYYAVFFPHGKAITLGFNTSCQTFCAYHGTIADAGGAGEVTYGVHPDFQPGSGCEVGCGAAATPFGNYTQVASHELVETMTDPEIGLATVLGPPLSWYDSSFGEIGDICNDQNGHVVGSDGVTYDVQTEFSNALNDCVVTSPLSSPLVISGAAETCRGTTGTAVVTVLGGAGRFTSDVTLGLGNVSPAPPAGGEITATFDPNPVPTPATSGSTSAMRIATTPSTPAGTYTLPVQAASTGLTSTATTTFVVRSAVPGGPTLLAPANGADGVASVTTFTWSAVDQSTSYALEIFDGNDCTGSSIHAFETNGTSFALPADQALAPFQPFSWRVTASNACGGAGVSVCANFRTASCSGTHELVTNGSFEDDLAGWTVDLSAPPPAVSGDNPHAGAKAVLLGTVSGSSEPFGDSQISQVLSLPAGSSPKLAFAEWPLSTDAISFDQQYVRVTPISPAGATVVLMNEVRNDRTYIQREFDLSQFAGMTVKLTFGVHQDGAGDITGMFLDDIIVSDEHCGPPDFVLHVTPPAFEEVCAGGSLLFAVSVDSVNGPNFTSPVTLSAAHLPPGATAVFARNPINPGESTTMTLVTTPPTASNHYDIDISAVAVTPPPDGPKTVTTTVVIDTNVPGAPEIVNPRIGEVNVSRRPTLSWTSPFVPESPTAGSVGSAPQRASAFKRTPFLWELAATRAPGTARQAPHPGMAPSRSATAGGNAPTPFEFGSSAYHIQIARDVAFTTIVVDAQVGETSFTVPVDLDIATQYFWRVASTNACGTGAFSSTGSFIVGACFEDWGQAAPIPLTSGPSQSTVIASPSDNKLYVIGGGLGAGPSVRIDQLWVFDPATESWTHKADVPSPGVGANFGAAAELGGTIYVFGGIKGPPGTIVVHRALWRYDIAANQWSRGADLPTDNFGAAVAAIDGKIYLAYGSGFGTQTWQYDPATDTYTRKADAPVIASTFRVHGVALGGELHAFAGGFEGHAHVIYNPAANAWRLGPSMPFTATDPAVGMLGGKVFVVGGRPVAHTQIFDPATDSWSQGTPILGATTGVDNTAGAALGSAFHLVGGFDGASGVSTHWRFHACNAGGLSSAALVPFVDDGNGKVTGIGNERTSILIDNAVSGTTMTVSCFLYGTNGDLLGHDSFQLAPNELKIISDVVRTLPHTTGVQNAIGSVALFGTEVFHGMASVVNNVTSDPALEDGQPLAGGTSGFVPTIGSPSYLTQTAFANASASTALLELVAYPPGGGDTPEAATVVFVPAHGLVSFPDTVKKLGLPSTFVGQLSWSSNQAMSVMAREVTRNNRNYSGFASAHSLADASSTAFVSYVEDTNDFSTALVLSNPGAFTANVTVHFFEISDATGAASGVEHTRDIPVKVNSAAPIADIVRWAQRDTATTPSGKRGFLVITTPQAVTAQATIVDRVSLDPAVPEGNAAMTSGFSPLVIRVEATPFAPIDAAATTLTSQSRFALSNPGSTPVTVQLVAYNATGAQATGPSFVVPLAAHGQFFSDNLARDMGLPAVFLGWITVASDAPVLVYNHRQIGDGGSTVPVHGQ